MTTPYEAEVRVPIARLDALSPRLASLRAEVIARVEAGAGLSALVAGPNGFISLNVRRMPTR